MKKKPTIRRLYEFLEGGLAGWLDKAGAELTSSQIMDLWLGKADWQRDRKVMLDQISAQYPPGSLAEGLTGDETKMLAGWPTYTKECVSAEQAAYLGIPASRFSAELLLDILAKVSVDPTYPGGYWQWTAAAWHPRRGGEIVLKTVYRWVWLHVPRT